MKNVLIKDKIDQDEIHIFVTRVKIIYGDDSFLVDIESDEKKRTYTFTNLKEDSCNYWRIEDDKRNNYHIVNKKLFVYCPRAFVWDVHKTAFENSNKNILIYIHMELLDRASIIMERNTNDKKNEKFKSIAPAQNIKSANINVIIGTEIFTSEIEEYISFYRKWEALFQVLCRKKKNINAEFPIPIKEEVKEEDNDEEKKQKEQRYQDILQKRQKEIEDKIRAEKKKPEEPIYISMFTIYKYRLFKFWSCIFSLIFAITIYLQIYLKGTLYLYQENDMTNVLLENIIFSPIYKNFLKNEDTISSKNIQEYITTKRELLIFLNIIFNNLVLTPGFGANNPKVNSFFYSNNEPYEFFYGIRIGFKFNNPRNKSEALSKNYFNITNNNITDSISYFNEFLYREEDNSPISINSGYNISVLQSNDKNLCDGCFEKREIKFSNITDTNSSLYLIDGLFGTYDSGSYYFDINPYKFTIVQFNYLMEVIKDMIIEPNCRMMYVNLNILNIYFMVLQRVQLLFEFSIIGNVFPNINSIIFETKTATNDAYQIFNTIAICQVGIFLVALIFNIISTYLAKKKIKISSFIIYYDLSVIIVFAICNFIYIQRANEQKKILGDNLIDTKSNSTNYEDWRYRELGSLTDIDDYYYQFYSMLCLIVFIRTLLFFMASPLVKFIWLLFRLTLKNIFNILVILIIFILSFTLIFHIILGGQKQEFSDLSTTLVIVFASILGKLQYPFKKDANNIGSINNLIIIVMMILIKFILFRFIFAVIKETYDKLVIEYKDFKRRDHYKLVKETIFLFLKYFLFPISLYFMYNDYMFFKRKYGNKDLIRVIHEGGDGVDNLTFHKMIIQRRVVYLVHEKLKENYYKKL
jgi:hypothetical protein